MRICDREDEGRKAVEKNSSMTEDFFSFVLALMHARACACERES